MFTHHRDIPPLCYWNTMNLRIAILAIPIATLCISIWGFTLARSQASEPNGTDLHESETDAMPEVRLKGWVVESTTSAE
jgi:hypothetical protein